MTVCVAAIAERGGMLFTGADRMLTKGDVTYEPKDAPKAWTLGDKAIVLLAGNISVQAEIAYAFAQEVADDKGEAKRPILEYAQIYAACFRRRRDRIRERIVLGLRGLTMDSYLANASRMPESWSRQIDQDLASFELPPDDGIEAIFAGKDATGSHIFTVENSKVTSHDFAGYAVIGSGYSVADSQFGYAQHSPNVSAPRALYTLFRAKRMAERSLGVGDTSDWHVIEESTQALHNDVLKLLEKLYRQERRQDEQRFVRAEKQIRADIAKRLPPKAETTSSLTSPSTEQPQPSGQSESGGKG